MKESGIRLNRGLGQHFLVDGNILSIILGTAELSPKDTVLEVGAGIGTLTEELCARAVRVWAVEKDPKLYSHLQRYFRDTPNLILKHADVMRLDLAREIPRTEGSLKLVSNLPYRIATPLLLKVLEELPQLELLVVMVQRELADRYMGMPGSKSYGATSVKMRYFCCVERILQVPPSVFFPPPRVESALLRMKRRSQPPVEVDDRGLFFRFVEEAFAQRRKTLVNSVYRFLSGSCSKDEIAALVRELGWDKAVRGEELGLEEFAVLYNRLLQQAH